MRVNQRLSRYVLNLPGESRPFWLSEFRKLNPARARRKSIAVFDIETEDATLLGNPGGICFTSEINYPEYETFDNKDKDCTIKFLEYFLRKRYRGFIAYAHKGMSFDISHILAKEETQKWIMDNGFSVYVDRSFAVIKKAKHAWYLGDSLRVMPEKLEKILQSFAPHRTKAPLPTGKFSFQDKAWERRIVEDTLGLYESLIEIQKIVKGAFGIPLSFTMPATALKAARTMLPFPYIKRTGRKAMDWIRAGAYSGGRIEVFVQGEFKNHIYCFDINSAYAWAMKGEFPLGRGRYTRQEPKMGYYIGRTVVQVPGNETFPPVLSRLFNHAFCVGEFQALLTKEEVDFARSCGATVKFIEGWTWIKTYPVFKDFIEKCEQLRATDYQGPLGKTIKLMQNGLYGILGMAPFRKVQMLSLEEQKLPWFIAFDNKTGEYVEGAWETIKYRESPNMMHHYAAIITARVRVRLSEYIRMFAQYGLKPMYAHTDSIWAQGKNDLPPEIQAEVSKEYGKLKLEHTGLRAIVVTPGEAALQVNEKEWHIASKGWHAEPTIFEQGGTAVVKQTQVYRAGTALKRRVPGQVINKIVLDYNAISNRLPAKYRPGNTIPKKALQYKYDDYWSYSNWYVGKLLAERPNRKKYCLTPELLGV